MSTPICEIYHKPPGAQPNAKSQTEPDGAKASGVGKLGKVESDEAMKGLVR